MSFSYLLSLFDFGLLFQSVYIKEEKEKKKTMSGMDHGGGHGDVRPNQSAAGLALGLDTSDADRFSTSSTNFHDDFPYDLPPFSPRESSHGDLLKDSLFPEWGSGTTRPDPECPDEMQKKDPLATQIWRLYSRTKAQLPNQERMENLTWRMMAMSLKRKERERLHSYVPVSLFADLPCTQPF